MFQLKIAGQEQNLSEEVIPGMQENKQPQIQNIPSQPERVPLWTANFILLFLSALAMFFAFHSLIPTLPIYISSFGGTDRAAGLALATLTFAAVISRPFAGWALDRYGRKMIFLGGLLFFMLPIIVYIWMIPVVYLIILRFFQGLAWGAGNTGAMTTATDVVPVERLGEGMGFFSLTLSISMSIAPILALWLIKAYSFPLFFAVCSFLVLISITLACFIKFPQVERRINAPRPVFLEKTALRPTLVIILVGISYSAPLSFLALHAGEQGLAPVGIYFTSFALASLLSRPLSGIIVDRFGGRGYDLGTLIGIAASIAAVPFLAQSCLALHLVMGGIFYGIGFGFVQPMMLALAVISVTPEKKGAANASYWTGFDIGVATGSIAWGLVAASLGYRTMFNLTIFPLVAALLVYFFCFSKTGKQAKRQAV